MTGRASLVLTFEHHSVPDGHGADDYESDKGDAFTLRALHAGQRVGELRYNLVDTGLIWVRWIEVEPRLRRRGIASELMREVQHLHPQAGIDTGGLTDDGGALWEALFGA